MKKPILFTLLLSLPFLMQAQFTPSKEKKETKPEIEVEPPRPMIERAPPPPPPPPPPRPMDEDIFKVVEDQPSFSGCEEVADRTEQRKCTQGKLNTYLDANLQYPKIAMENGVEGTCVVQFVVEKDGSISDAKILRDVGAGCGQEALRLVNNMPNWNPGKQRGQAVRVQYNLPVKFRLDGNKPGPQRRQEQSRRPGLAPPPPPDAPQPPPRKEAPPQVVEIPDDVFEEFDSPPKPDQSGRMPPPPPPPPPAPRQEDKIFKVVEVQPCFQGCGSINGKAEKRKCSDENMLKFIYKNLNYPAEARKNSVEGIVVIQFVIDKNGSVQDAVVMRNIGAGCGEAALQVINMMPNWEPGTQRGKPVKVQMNLPVKFSLD